MTEHDHPAHQHRLLTVAQAARLLNIGRTTVYQLVKQGALHEVHIGRSARFTCCEVDRYVERLDASHRTSGDGRQRNNQPVRRGQRRTATTQDGLFGLATARGDADAPVIAS